MLLQKLVLENYRNYDHLELDLKAGQCTTCFIGENAQGKTNILEAIYLLALTKSFRPVKNQELIQGKKEYARIKGIFQDGQKNTELEIFLGNPPQPSKSLKKNGVKIANSEFIGNFQVVLFQPEDLNILYLGPDLRRRYLDILNVQIKRSYLQALQFYRNTLKQRNALLSLIKEGRASKTELEPWDAKLVDYGSILIKERSKTVEFFQNHLQEIYQEIAQGKEEISINYQHGLHENFSNRENISILYQKSLEKNREIDIRAGVTTIGPHRDDVEFLLNKKKLHLHASRGEYRTLLLALKLLEISFFEQHSKQKPILLLDDVFSELDPERQKKLLESAKNYQTLITSAEEHSGIIHGRKDLNCFYKVENGKVFDF